MHTIYTIGYTGLSRADLVRAANALDLAVVDIRFRAGSRKADWNKSALANALGDRYAHIRELGNVNYRIPGSSVQFLDPATGIQRVADLLARRSVILLYACADVQHCHRKPAADLLAASTGAPVIHWTPGDIAAVPLDESAGG